MWLKVSSIGLDPLTCSTSLVEWIGPLFVALGWSKYIFGFTSSKTLIGPVNWPTDLNPPGQLIET